MEFWESAAQKDPLWAILSDPSKKGRRWTAAEFFETGRREISLLMYQLRRLGQVPDSGRALDFGCGIGRLSQALGGFFAEVVGIDISPTMIRLAGGANRAPSRVSYVLNGRDDLQCFASGSFDFIYSDLVLHHLAPEVATRFILEFVRLLRVGGIAVFQLASHRRTPDEQASRAVPMADGAYRARLRIIDGMLELMRPAQRALVNVDVENISGVGWDQTVVGPIRLGNHWLSSGGERMLIQDDGRQELAAVIAPGMRTPISIAIQAPPEPGPCVCEFDLVHEGITWFADRGSMTVQSRVEVAATEEALPPVAWAGVGADPGLSLQPDVVSNVDYAVQLPATTDLEIGEFPMYGVPRDTVLQILADQGAPTFYVEPDDRGGPEWHGYRYFAKRLK